MQFLSKEWADAYEALLTKGFPEGNTATKASAAILELFRGAPGGDQWVYIDWEEGELCEFKTGTDLRTAPVDADFKMFSDYNTWLRTLSLKDNPIDNILGGKIEFYGSMRDLQPALKLVVGAILSQGYVSPNGKVLAMRPAAEVSKLVNKLIFS